MSLLSPLFLLGLLGIALPVWLHRLQTQTTDREKFSSTMFLEQARHRIHVQRKLKYLLLLAARILLLLVLVFAFARPVLFVPPEAALGQEDTHHIIVVDTSFSMNHDGHFAEALGLAGGVIDAMESGDQASLLRADTRVQTVAEATADPAVLREALATLAPGNGRLDLGAMIASLDNLVRESQANIALHLVGDFQDSGQPVRFADLIPDLRSDRAMRLELHRVTVRNEPNWTVEAVNAAPSEVRVTVRGFNTEATDKTVRLSVNGVAHGELTRPVPASGRAVFLFDDVDFAAGDNRVDADILQSDDLPQDDRRHSVFDNSPPAPVLLLTENPDSLSVTYVTAALETAPRPYRAEVTQIADFDARVMSRYPWLIVEDLGAVNESLAPALRQYVEGGGSVLAALGERSLGLANLPLTGHAPTGSLNLRAGSRHLITRIDSTHPVLQQSSGWSNVIITQVLPIAATEQDNVLISLDSNTPFLLERRMGQGRLMLFNTSLDNTWTDLPLKPVFVGFMAEAARYLSGADDLQREQVADTFLQLQSSGQVFDPQGQSLLSLEATARAQDVRLEQLGYYEVVTPAGQQLVAVNPDLRESDLTVMAPQVLQNWQNTVANTAGASTPEAATAATAANEEDRRQVEIWRAVLIFLVMMVLAEALLGNRHLRVNTGAPE